LQTAIEFASIEAAGTSGDERVARPKRLRLLPSTDAPALADVFPPLGNEAGLSLLPAAPPQSLALQIRRHQPDLVLLAVRNPAITPWRNDSALREAFSLAPAILFVSAINKAAKRLAANLGIASFLPQNLTRHQLIAAIHAAAAGLAVALPSPSDKIAEPIGTNDKNLHDLSLVEQLTPRETAVLDRMAHGCGNKEIAAQLGISEHTVKYHVSSILAKLGATSRTEAVTIGIFSGLVAI
jgi:NarL family two-component system response regulator YdfI